MLGVHVESVFILFSPLYHPPFCFAPGFSVLISASPRAYIAVVFFFSVFVYQEFTIRILSSVVFPGSAPPEVWPSLHPYVQSVGCLLIYRGLLLLNLTGACTRDPFSAYPLPASLRTLCPGVRLLFPRWRSFLFSLSHSGAIGSLNDTPTLNSAQSVSCL